MSRDKKNPLDGYKGEIIKNPVKAIARYCTTVCTYDLHERNHCGESATCTCPLYAFSYGTNPYRRPIIYTDEERKIKAERLLENCNKKHGAIFQST